MKIKRSSFIREPYDRDCSIFYDYDQQEDEKHRRKHKRTAANKNVKSSSSTTEASKSHSYIEKGLARGLNYPAARRQSSRHTSATRERRAQKSVAALQDIITARNVGLRITNDIDERRRFDSAAQEERRDTPENCAASEQRRVKDDAVKELDEGVSARNRGAASASHASSSSVAVKISQKSQLDLSGSVRERMEMGRGTMDAVGRALGERSAVIDRVIVAVREIALNPRTGNARTAGEDDLSSDAVAELEPAATILPGRARSPGDRGKSAGETNTGDTKLTATTTAVSDQSFQQRVSEGACFLFLYIKRFMDNPN